MWSILSTGEPDLGGTGGVTGGLEFGGRLTVQSYVGHAGSGPYRTPHASSGSKCG